MKTVKYFVLIITGVLFFTNCTIQTEKWEAANLSEIPDVLMFSGKGKCSTANFYFPYSCEYKSNQDWCQINHGYGYYSDDLIKIEINKTGKPRTATISVLLNGETMKTINIEQAALDYIIIGDLCIQKTDISNDVLTLSVAQSLCASSRVEDFSDWRLPTLDELRILYENREMIGGFKTSLQNNKEPFYWFYEWAGPDGIKSLYNGNERRDISDNEVGEDIDKYNVYARLVRTVRSDDYSN